MCCNKAQNFVFLVRKPALHLYISKVSIHRNAVNHQNKEFKKLNLNQDTHRFYHPELRRDSGGWQPAMNGCKFP